MICACDVRIIGRRQAARAARRLRYGAKSWQGAAPRGRPHRGDAARASTSATSSPRSGHGAKHLYETVYCARGQAENFIKLHKAQLASDRTSCRDPAPTSCA